MRSRPDDPLLRCVALRLRGVLQARTCSSACRRRGVTARAVGGDPWRIFHGRRRRGRAPSRGHQTTTWRHTMTTSMLTIASAVRRTVLPGRLAAVLVGMALALALTLPLALSSTGAHASHASAIYVSHHENLPLVVRRERRHVWGVRVRLRTCVRRHPNAAARGRDSSPDFGSFR